MSSIIRARDLLHLPEDTIWEMFDKPKYYVDVQFDDGVATVKGRAIIFTYYIWAIHQMYPLTPLLKEHVISGIFNTKTHLDMLSKVIMEACYDVYADKGINVEVLAKHAYDITNKIFNVFSIRLEEYVTSLNALDFVEVLENPVINNIRHQMFENNGYGEFNPDASNNKIEKALLEEPSLAHNTIAKISRSGLVRMGQIVQCIGARGSATDIDQRIFLKPILTGFATGLTELGDMMKESRSASQSKFYQKDPMRKSEYLNRNIQLSSAKLYQIHYSDCGSKDYLPININTKRLLKDMDGISYLDEETNTEKVIRPNSTHLIGKLVKIRSLFTCKHPDRYGVCVKCFGELGINIPEYTNLGHVCSAETQSKVGQLLLSNKHFIASAVAVALWLDDYTKNFLATGKGDSYLYLSPKLKNSTIKLIVKESQATNLGDIFAVDNVNTLVPYRLSEITNVEFELQNGETLTRYPVTVANDVRTASFTMQTLRYLRDHKWEYDESGNFIIDLSDWNFDKPLFELPQKHFSTLDYMLNIEGFIKGSSTRGRKSIMAYETHSALIMAFHDLVSLKLDVPLSYLQAIALSTMVQSRTERDYRLPMPRSEGMPTHYKQLMDLSSLAATMAYQGQTNALFSCASYILKDRPPHPLDWLLLKDHRYLRR